MESIKSKIQSSMKNILPIKKYTRSSVNVNFRGKDLSEKSILMNYTSNLNNFKISNKENRFKSPSSNKKIKSSVNTPKSNSKKKIKQGNVMFSTTSLKSKSPVYTPFAMDKTPLLKHFAQQVQKYQKSDFKFLFQIGSGGFGRVWKVQNKKNQIFFAMKQISKAKVIMKKSVTSVINQKQILEDLSNPFIINMKNAFQDRQYLYLVMEYLKGGDLRYHMCFYEHFSQQETKFIVACIIIGLQYVHSRNIIHRDLKPQNLVFEDDGYVRITDFGVARKHKTNNSQQTSGTPGYMSPQVICRMNHSFQSDFFALGVIIYQMILGIRPYMGDSRKQIRQKILAHQAKITQQQLPNGWNVSCVDFINKLLKRNKQSRLGYNGIHQIKSHSWLKSINWSKMNRKQIVPPFQPGIITQTIEYQKQIESSSQTEVDDETNMLLRTDEIQKLFKTYNSTFKGKKLKKN